MLGFPLNIVNGNFNFIWQIHHSEHEGKTFTISPFQNGSVMKNVIGR